MTSPRKAYFVGGGIGSLAAAAFLVRDGGMPGSQIGVLEAAPVMCGGLDGAGDAERGYSMRGGTDGPGRARNHGRRPGHRQRDLRSRGRAIAAPANADADVLAALKAG